VEWYEPSQVSIRGGSLQLSASHLDTTGRTATGAQKTYPYRSGMVTTYPSLHFTYGYLQVVARVPSGPDLWPALWLLPVNANPKPEIDILEGENTPRDYLIAFHPNASGQPFGHVTHTPNLAAGWHTFGINWQPGSLTWYFDGEVIATVTTDVPAVPMYFLANLAVENYAAKCLAATAPRDCTGAMDIRSVELWQ
jgi:beta-glucanase (GH16 family)